MNLVIMAAGMGSRFGGLKQIVPIDDNGNFIIDYSIYDAIKAGFDKVTFIIKRENFDDFRNTVGKRIEKNIKVEYVFQEANSFVPKHISITQRVKPWGTAHAVLCAKDKVNEDFAIANADDFYGPESFKKIANYLKEKTNNNNFAMVGFKTINTLTENGAVKRGVCNIVNGNLQGLTESVIESKNGKIYKKPIATNIESEIMPETLVSMNLFGFTPKLFDILEKGFEEFLDKNKNDLSTCEYFIPTILTEYINKKYGDIKVLDTNDKWYGLTYKEDFENVKQGIKKMVDMGIYPTNLWGNNN